MRATSAEYTYPLKRTLYSMRYPVFVELVVSCPKAFEAFFFFGAETPGVLILVS